MRGTGPLSWQSGQDLTWTPGDNWTATLALSSTIQLKPLYDHSPTALKPHGLPRPHRCRPGRESRRATEELGDDYNRLAYFERSVQALANLLCEKRVLSRDEMAARLAAIRRNLHR